MAFFRGMKFTGFSAIFLGFNLLSFGLQATEPSPFCLKLVTYFSEAEENNALRASASSGENFKFPAGLKLTELIPHEFYEPVSPQKTQPIKVKSSGTWVDEVPNLFFSLGNENNPKIEVLNYEGSIVLQHSAWFWSGPFEREREFYDTSTILSEGKNRSVEAAYSEYTTFPARARSMALSPSRDFVAVGIEEGKNTGDTRLVVLNAKSLEQGIHVEKTINFFTQPGVAGNVSRTPYGFSELAFSPDGEFLVGLGFQTVRVYKVIYKGKPGESIYSIIDLKELDLKDVDRSLIFPYGLAHRFLSFENFAFSKDSSILRIKVSAQDSQSYTEGQPRPKIRSNRFFAMDVPLKDLQFLE